MQRACAPHPTKGNVEKVHMHKVNSLADIVPFYITGCTHYSRLQIKSLGELEFKLRVRVKCIVGL